MSFSEWREIKLGEICVIVMGQSPKGENCNNNEIGTPLLNGPTEFGAFYPKAVQYTTDVRKQSAKGDILFCVRGSTTGRMNWADKEYAIGRGLASIRHKSGIDYNHFVKGVLDYKLDEILNSATGSTFPNVGKDLLNMLTVRVGSLAEQKAIAATLSCLDEKIELNNRMNKSLEEMAQAVFKSWFVDFEPFQDGEFEDSELGMIPKGWRVESLDQVANYLNGLAMQKYRPETDVYLPVIKIKELNQEQVDSNSDQARVDIPEQYVIENGDVIFSWSGTLLVKIWTGGKGALNQHLFKVTSDKYDKWFYYFWTVYHLEKFRGIASDKATTMGHIKRSHLSEAKVIIPDDKNYVKLNDIMQPLLNQIIDIKVQNGTLRDLRDSLLPKLMSGEIRVPIEEVQ